ncbi:uncharacterized protein [Henckelia pumila]|uniref:uncharacterized protein n=1 Tax=Henckelia pumila TaxID=405737 RepID=UPI003C6E9215
MEITDIFFWMKDTLSRMDFEKFAMRTWATWSQRLKLVHNSKGNSRDINVEWSEKLLYDFHNARMALKLDSMGEVSRSSDKWVAPPVNSLKLDVDAAYNERANSYAYGGIIRDHGGRPVLAFGRKLDKPQSVTVAELFAIKGGLKIAQDFGILVNQITSDSLLAVRAVTGLEEDFSYAGATATDIRYHMASHHNLNITHVRRSANSIAHSIAAFVISSLSHLVLNDFSFQ